MARELRVQIVGDASSLQRALGAASSSAGSFGSSVARAGKIAALAVGGAAIGGLAVVLKTGAEEWMEHAKVAAQTAAVLKTTGGVAGVTQKHVEDLAGALLRKTGIDDEAIQANENLLLSFTRVRNEAGKGNDIFDRATKVILDYSVRTGKSATQATMLFGKTLQEVAIGKIPTSIRGLGKLSDSQIKMMKTMVDAGNVAGAQGVILSMLEQRYGGAAEAAGSTLPGKINILKESFRNLSGEIFASVVPALTRVVDWTAANWPQIEAVFKAVFTAIGVAIRAGVEAVQAIIPIGQAVVGWVQSNWPQISATFTSVFETVKAAVQGAVSFVQAVWARFGSVILSETRAVWEYIRSTIQNVLTVIRGIINIVLGLIHGDWSRVWQGIQQMFGGIVNQILAVARLFGTSLLNGLRAAWELLKIQASAAWRAFVAIVRGAVGAAISAAVAVGKGIISGIDRGLTGIVLMIQGWFQKVWAWIKGAAASAAGFAFGIGSAIIRGIGAGIESLAGWLADKLKSAVMAPVNAVKGLLHIGSPSGLTRDQIGIPIMQGIAAGILAGMPEATTAAEKAAHEVTAKMQAAQIMVAVRNAGRVIGLEHARAIVMGLLQGTPGIVAQARAALNSAMAAARQAVVSARGSFASAFQSLAQGALAAFDEAAGRWVAPSQKILDAAQIKDQADQMQRSLDDANAQLSDARAQLAGATTDEERAAAERAVTDATRAVGDAQRAQWEFNLAQQAARETAAHNARMARDREQLAAQLLQLQRELAKHPAAWGTAQARIMAILRAHNVPMYQAGQRLASMFADGLRNGIAAVVKAARDLANALEAVEGGPTRPTGGGRPSAGGPPRPPDRSGFVNRMGPAGGAGLTVNLHVAGNVHTEADLVDAVYTGLLRIDKRNSGLGFSGA